MEDKKLKKKIPTKQLIRRIGIVLVILGAVMILLGCLLTLALIIVGAVFLVQGFIMLCVNQDMEDRGYYEKTDGEENEKT